MDTTYSLKLPPKNYRRIIEELSVVIPDPVLKLKFLKQAINEHQKISAPYKLYPPIAGIAFRKKLLDNAERIWPGSKKAAKNLIRKGVVSAPHIKLLWLYKLRYVIGSAILMFFILGVGTALSPLVRSYNLGALIKLNSNQGKTTNTNIIFRKPIFYSQRPKSGDSSNSSIVKPEKHQNEPELVLKCFQNPVLIALTSQQTMNSTSDLITQKPLLFSQTSESENHSPSPVVKPVDHQNEPELILKYFHNPILMALISQEAINPTSDLITQKPLLFSQTSESENHSPSPVVKSVNHQNGFARVPKYLQNPVLMALTSQQTINSTSEPISQKPLLPSQPYNSGNHPPLATIEPEKHQNGPELVLKYFHSPILWALTSQQTKNFTSDLITQKSLLFSQTPESGKQLPSPTVKPVNYQNGVDQLTKYLQNPILMALTSQSALYFKSDRIGQKTLLSAQPRNSGNHPTLAIIEPAKHQNVPELVLKYFHSPILWALASQQTKNSTSDPITQKTLFSSQTPESENHSPSPVVKPANYQNGVDQLTKYLQNPILMALTSQSALYFKSDRIGQKTPLSAQPRNSKNHPPSSTVKPAKFQNRPEQVLKLLQNPILMALISQQVISPKSDRTVKKTTISSRPHKSEDQPPSSIIKPVNHQNRSEQVPEYLQKPIWLVEKISDREIYSNRLQIITTYTIANMPREYYRFPKNSNHLPANSKTTNKISGIVYHASESDLYPFMPEMNRSILKYSKRLIKYLLRKKSYHFFIDRFGRVYRLVQEDHVAFHAGNAIWADEEEIYLNLNHAFIGICFEGKDFEEINIRKQKKGQITKSSLLKPTGISSFNEAQLRSGKELTDWLRVKYNIPQHNCVPHALISVNPARMLIGWHLDLARGFPFAKFGLSDKYREPLPSIVEFGFRYDAYFKKIFNNEIWPGIHHSEEIMQRQARNSGMSFAKYRKSLQRKFSRYTEWNKKMLEIKHQTDIKPPQGSLTAAQN